MTRADLSLLEDLANQLCELDKFRDRCGSYALRRVIDEMVDNMRSALDELSSSLPADYGRPWWEAWKAQ